MTSKFFDEWISGRNWHVVRDGNQIWLKPIGAEDLGEVGYRFLVVLDSEKKTPTNASWTAGREIPEE